jgi:hypothetical protein
LDQAEFAAKRYRRYKAELNKQSLKQDLISLLLKIFDAIVKILQQTRLIRRREIEKVTVE